MSASPPIRAEITEEREASALGLTVGSGSPVLALCRKLVEAGHDPASPLHAYRGDVLCLRVRSIGEGARIAAMDVGFRWLAPAEAGSAIAAGSEGLSTSPGEADRAQRAPISEPER